MKYIEIVLNKNLPIYRKQIACQLHTQYVDGIKNLPIYRKQIACQLHTQYVDGIYSNPVILKSKLRVTHGHQKLNH